MSEIKHCRDCRYCHKESEPWLCERTARYSVQHIVTGDSLPMVRDTCESNRLAKESDGGCGWYGLQWEALP